MYRSAGREYCHIPVPGQVVFRIRGPVIKFCGYPVPVWHEGRIVCLSGYKKGKADIPAVFRRIIIHFRLSFFKKHPVDTFGVAVGKSTVNFTVIPLSAGSRSHVPDPFQPLRLDGPGEVDHRITVIRSCTCAVQTDENIKLLMDFFLNLEMDALVSIL